MSINNISNTNANQIISITSRTQSENTDKLSSGYKVNRDTEPAATVDIRSNANSQNIKENAAASMSNIRDIDEIDAMIARAQKNILAQPEDAVAAQANQQSAGVTLLLS